MKRSQNENSIELAITLTFYWMKINLVQGSKKLLPDEKIDGFKRVMGIFLLPTIK